MTSKRKLLLIHGLNNSAESLKELGKSLESDFDVSYLTLPHHGENPLNFNFDDSLDLLRRLLMERLTPDVYILSYSLGCSYIQYLFENKLIEINLKKVIYLSPALRPKLKLALFKFLPSYFPIPSFSPKEFRFRSFCYWGQYQTLLKLTSLLQLKEYPIIIADPDDEMINLKDLEYFPLHRKYLSYGKHHISFHPRYFQKNDWGNLIETIKRELK